MSSKAFSVARPFLIVVNDDATQLRLLATQLQRENFDVAGFQSVESALASLEAGRLPDLFITDLNMPEIDGWRFCRLLRSSEYARLNNIPILVASATFTGKETEEITRSLGADMFLPLPCERKVFVEAIQNALLRKPTAPPPRVLLVEDSKSLTRLLKQTFTAKGYCVDTAHTVAEASQKIQDSSFDLGILDYHLPDGAGDAVLMRIREHCPEMVCVMMTTDPRPELALAWLKAGASAYARKPFDPEYLVELCEKARREHAMLRTAAVLESRAQALRERETLVSTVIASAPMYTAIVNKEGVFTLLEGRALERHGIEPERYIGTSACEAYRGHPEAIEGLRQALAGENVHLTMEFESRTYETSIAPILDMDGGIQGAVIVATDTTDRIHSQKTLRKQGEQLRGIASSIPGVVYQFIFRSNGTMEVLYLGKQAVDFFGVQPEEGAFFEQFLEHLQPEERERLLRSVVEVATEFKPWNYEGRFIKSNGEIMWFKAMAQPARSGEDILYNGIILDITQTKIAEQALRESEGRYSAIFNNAHDAIFIHDLEGNVLDVNQTMMNLYGVSREEALRMKILEDFSAPGSSQEVLAELWNAIINNEQRSFEWEARRPKDGEIFPVEVWLRRIHIEDQDLVLANIRDIRERKNTEQMVQLRLRLTQFAVNHSLKELLQESLDEICGITQSPIGFYHFVEPDQRTVSLQAWSTRTLREFCAAKSLGSHYSLADAGVWADCVRERRPVIHNDYTALTHRKGLPEGHAPVIRELLIPVVRNGLVVAALGIGNKLQDYTQRDVETCSFLSDVVWAIVAHKRVEEEQEKTQNLLHAAITQSPAGILVADAPNAALRWVNSVAMKVRGEIEESLSNADTAPNSSRWQAFYPDGSPYPPDETPLSRAVFKGETTQNEELIFHTLSGEKRWLSLNAAPIFDRMGKITAGIAIFTDITEHKKSEELLLLNTERTQALLRLNQMSEASLQTITDFALEEAVRLTKSEIGYLAFLNEAENVLTMHSWSRSAMAECAVVDKPFIYPLETTGLWGEAVRQRRPIITNDYLEPNPWKKGLPGGHIALRRHMNVPIFFGTRMVALTGVGNKEAEYDDTDIQQLTLLMEGMWNLIERKRANEALSESEERFRYLSEAAFEGIMVHEDGVILDANAKFVELFRYDSSTDLIGQDALALLMDEASRSAVRTWMTSDLNELLEIKGIRKDGSIFPGEMQSRGIVYQGRSAQVVAMRDITERKRAEQDQKDLEVQLLQSQKLESIGQLAGGVAHDFNNILAAVLGYADLALDEMREGHPLYEYLREIVTAGNRARDLTRQLLAFARKQTLELQPVDLNEVLLGFEKMLRRTIRENVAIKTALAPESVSLLGDIGQIEQIILNLAINAQDAMPDGGTLVLETRSVFVDESRVQSMENVLPGRYATLIVKDTGVGMDKNLQKRIFDPFFTTKGIGKGTGLGLSTVYGIVKQHKGFIWVHSEPGEGSAFHVCFPLMENEAAPVNLAAGNQSSKSGVETILVIEDEEVVRLVTCKMLRKLGYTVLEADSGECALEIVSGYPGKIHLVLSDVIMPDVNGRELYDRLAALRAGMKVLYMSGYAADVISHHGVLDRGTNLIQKPFNISQLSVRLREILDQFSPAASG